jgi:hypothetical protein
MAAPMLREIFNARIAGAFELSDPSKHSTLGISTFGLGV